MKYKFHCTKCNKTETIEIPLNEYEGFVAKCPKCGSKMDRVYESPNIAGCSCDDCGEDCSGGCSCGGNCSGGCDCCSSH